ncbi:MAG: succinate dehydrogenase iron-sulfur subunit [Anaerolineae bacterium]|nr:succinate dehydrogenase iron-sulfur subunit [Anaerolineae bacterium]
MNARYTFNVSRFDPTTGDPPRYQAYAVDVPQGMTVLEALLRIQAEQDGSLAFRYACRGAVCGSCAMVIEGQVRLACRTQVRSLEGNRITVDPLPHLPRIKDLVVDMDPFFETLRAIQPWLQPGHSEPEREHQVDPADWSEAEPYTNCILCASCHGVCPVVESDPAYLGPAALAKHYRFLADVRDVADAARVALVNDEHGVWGCDMVWNCTRVCPRGVTPTQGIGKTRARIRRAERAQRA